MLNEPDGPHHTPPHESATEAVKTSSAVPDGSPYRSRRGLIAKILVAASVVGAFTVLALNDLDAHQNLTRSQQNYSTSQSHLKATRATLTETTTQLTSVQRELKSTTSALATSKTALAAKEQALTGVQNNLNDAKSSLTIKSGQVETLKSCLTGVSIAFSDFANGDYSGTISALQAVKVSCDAATALL